MDHNGTIKADRSVLTFEHSRKWDWEYPLPYGFGKTGLLTDNQVRAIRQDWETTHLAKAEFCEMISKQYGVHIHSVYNLLDRRTYKNVS